MARAMIIDLRREQAHRRPLPARASLARPSIAPAQEGGRLARRVLLLLMVAAMLALYGLALSGCGAAQATVAPTASDSPRSGETAVSRATGQQAHETTAAQASSASTVQAGGASAIAGEVSQLLEITDPQERAAVQIAAEKVRYLGRTPNIVATSPAVVDVCDRLELDLVGVGHSSLFETPERYAGATEVGPPMSPDMEIVGSLAPDWILSPGSLQADLQPKYEAVGCDYAFLNLKSVQGMYRSIQELGEIFDRRDQASALVAEFTDFYRSYQAKNVAKTRPRVLVLMGMPGSYVIATPNSYVGNLVELAGGENVYAGAAEDFLSVNTEDMQTKDPDIILRCSHALPDQVKQMFAEEFQTNDIWKHFRAVQDGRVHDLPYDLFGMSATFDYPQALELLQGLLYDE